MKFAVEYYDKTHEDLLSKHEKHEDIERLVEGGLSVPAEELLIYAMFALQKEFDGFRTYDELAAKVDSRRGEVEDNFELAREVLHAKLPPRDIEKSATQKVGEGLAIVAMNRIYGLTEADWKRIDETTGKKVLDHEFKLASTGNSFIQVEAKGSVVGGDAFGTKTPNISKAKGDTLEKKEVQRSTDDADIQCDRFGVITAIPTQPDLTPELYLVDPEGCPPDISPKKYKLLSRLSYYEAQLSYIGQFHFLMILRNRIRSIRRVVEYDRLDGLKLVNSHGATFGFPQAQGTLTLSSGGGVLGRVLPTSDERALFIGFKRNLFTVLTHQVFSDINAFDVPAHEVLVDSVIRYKPAGADSKRTVRAYGRGYVNSAGIAFAELSLGKPERQLSWG